MDKYCCAECAYVDQERAKLRVLSLDLANLSPEDKLWLHTLKNKAQALQGWLQMRYSELS